MILVTGATGLLGAHLLLELASAGKEVKALRRKNSTLKLVQQVFERAGTTDLLKQIQWVEGDVTEVFSVQEAMHGIELVYHCAGKVSFQKGEDAELFRINTEGTANVVNEALLAGLKGDEGHLHGPFAKPPIVNSVWHHFDHHRVNADSFDDRFHVPD